jgi:hypothetical protein
MKRNMTFADPPPLMTKARDNVALIVAAWTMLGAGFTATVAGTWRLFTYDSRVSTLERRVDDDDKIIAGQTQNLGSINKKMETEDTRKQWLAEYLRTNPVGKH